MIEELEKYAAGLVANDEVFSWLKTTGKKAIALNKITQAEMEHTLDFLMSPAAPSRLQRMGVVDAKRKADEWSKANQKKGRWLVDDDNDIEVIHSFADATRIVKLKSKKAYEREGFLMSHCLGGYTLSDQQVIYSYRDANNMPHATFEVRKQDNEILQIKGKGNGAIHPKYIHPILAFLEVLGMKIRPQDMVNLGYHHIHASHSEFLKKIPAAWKQVAVINGEYYAF